MMLCSKSGCNFISLNLATLAEVDDLSTSAVIFVWSQVNFKVSNIRELT